jgi:4-amino-4-deoxy-L-arabinose transferase-like glycosyltransferase
MKENHAIRASESASPLDALSSASPASTLVAGRPERVAGELNERVPLLDRLASPALALPLLFACGVMLFVVNLGGYPLYTKGETREAVTVFDIAHGGGIILPMRAGVEVPSKPLMMHWLAALVSLGAGQVNEWTVRLPSAVFAILGLFVCYLYVRRFFDQRAALIAALILGTSCQYLQAGGARVDMTLTFFLEVALFHFLAIAEGLSKRVALLYLSIACAVLTKGPIGLGLPTLVAVIWMAMARRFKVVSSLRLLRGALIIAAISGGWYLAATVIGGNAFIHKQLLFENLYRLFGRPGFNEGHAHPFYYVEAALLIGFLPWSPVAALAVVNYWKQPHKADARFSYMLVWFLVILVFFHLPHSKRGVYLLALYPALSTIVAVLLSQASQDRTPAIESACRAVATVTGGFLIAIGALALIGSGMLFDAAGTVRWILVQFGILVTELPLALRSAASEHWLAVVLIPLTSIGVGIWMLSSRPGLEPVVGGIAVGAIAMKLAVNLVIEPAIANTLSPKRFALQARQYMNDESVYYFGSLDYGFIFYSGRDVKFISVNTPLESIVGSEEQWPLMPADFRRQYHVVLRSNPTDLDGSGRLLLLRRTHQQF